MSLPLPSVTSWLRFVPAGAWAAAIFFASSRPRLPEPPIHFGGLDKIVHALVYALLAALLLWAARCSRDSRALLWAGVAAIYGATDEWHQAFVPLRDADLLDWIADAAGALLAAGLWLRFGRGAGAEPRVRE